MMDAQVTEEQVYAALSKVMDPELDHSVVELGLIQDVDIDEGTVILDVQLTSPHCPFAKEIIHSIKNAVTNIEGVTDVEVDWLCSGDD